MKRRNLNKRENLTFSNMEIEKIPIEEAMKLLKEVGIDVLQEEAELIMEFLYNYTKIVINECFRDYMD
ncbi:hypothetical protein COR50_07370 [Chitinophaga caeni]|uniref:Uncharacterized protein n=1 Tax=Chitinophaga caeni TaxID=2029983 RepID=A0A291QSS6_9BACT|nr:hypothetical protein [Chitinophaga caeni]ATL47020.1 hypothetical protein COR50_07370 [Chitinophaga caeni]